MSIAMSLSMRGKCQEVPLCKEMAELLLGCLERVHTEVVQIAACVAFSQPHQHIQISLLETHCMSPFCVR